MIIEDTESFENVFVSNYWYDADGERTVKTSGENEAIYVNSEFSGGNTGTARFSLYVSPYLVAGQGGKYTKHIYVGSQRIVSKLGDLASYGADPRRIPYAGHEADGLIINYKDKYNQQLQSIKDNYKTFDLPYNGKDNDDYVNGQGFCCNDGTPEAAQARAMARTRAANDNFHDKDNYEKMQFYYHPDHLGSSSYITNLDGEVSQHIEYVPFGEVFIEERNNTWNTPYLFNAKEFDEETGMYYYGARYYEPRLSLWMSVDPLQEKYSFFSTYCYTFNNPVIYIDPNGQENVVVVGSQNNTNSGSKLMFVNQGIRAIREFSENAPSENRTMLLFEGGYTKKQINAIRSSVQKYGGKLRLLHSSSDLIDYINTKSTDGGSNNRVSDRITQMEIYSHGLFGAIEFGYGTANADKYRLDFSNVSSLKKSAFKGTNSQIYSYACRTGLGRDYRNFGFNEFKDESLAQAIANSTHATVFAFPVRTDYQFTLGTWSERRYGFPNPAPKIISIDGAAFTPNGAAHPVKPGSTPLFLYQGTLRYVPMKK